MSAAINPFCVSLYGISYGKPVVVSHFGDQHLAGRLMAMGILPGSRIEVLRPAPFGGGLYVKADNLLIALRKEEAEFILVR